MAKLSEDQQKALDELLELQNAPDADDYEVAIERDGKTMRVPWSKVPATMRDFFGLSEPKPEGGEGEGGEGEGGDDGRKRDPKPPAGHRYFAGRQPRA